MTTESCECHPSADQEHIELCVPRTHLDQLDLLIADGYASDRSAALQQALRQGIRRMLSERDAQILTNVEPDHELDAWMSWAARAPLQLD